MRHLLFTVVLLSSSAVSQFIQYSFPAPSDHISGLAAHGNDVFVLDSLDNMVYRVHNFSGALLGETELPSLTGGAVGLAVSDGTLYFAESGTGVVRGITIDGLPVGLWDLSDSGLASISGLDVDSATGYMYIMDSGTNTVYRIELPLGTFAPVEFLTLVGCPQVHDISAPRPGGIPVACEDPVSPVRIYSSPYQYEPLGYGDYSSAAGVASHWNLENRFFFSDPDMGVIHLYCIDMGCVEEGCLAADGFSVTVSPNPCPGTASVAFPVGDPAHVLLRVYDTAGRVVFGYEEASVFGPCAIPVEGLPSGVYNVTVAAGDRRGSARFAILR